MAAPTPAAAETQTFSAEGTVQQLKQLEELIASESKAAKARQQCVLYGALRTLRALLRDALYAAEVVWDEAAYAGDSPLACLYRDFVTEDYPWATTVAIETVVRKLLEWDSAVDTDLNINWGVVEAHATELFEIIGPSPEPDE